MKKLLPYLLFVVFTLVFIHCKNNATPDASNPNLDLTGFTITPIGSGSAQKVEKIEANGRVMEEGILVNGKRNGNWVMYDPSKYNVVRSIANYVDDELNGLFLTFTDRGQIETLTSYSNGKYDGSFAKFSYGSMEEAAYYKNGQLHGVYRSYYPSGNLKIEAEYVDGKQHGNYLFYNDEGKVVLEYQYKNGEKVSGGVKN